MRLELDDGVLDELADRLAEKLAARLAPSGAPAATPWMSAQAAADYIGCSLSRVRKLTMLGDSLLTATAVASSTAATTSTPTFAPAELAPAGERAVRWAQTRPATVRAPGA